MTNEKLYEVLGDINEEHINEAKDYRKAKGYGWVKWSAMAACLCLVIGLVIPILNSKGGPGQSDPHRPLNVIEYNGAYYESIDMADTKMLDTYNLPHEITGDMIGISLGAGLDTEGNPTKQILYQYVPYAGIETVTPGLEQKRTQRAVFIIEDGGNYTFAVFCNFVGFDSNTHTEASEMLVVYGVDEAADIASITVNGEIITDREKINALFDGLYHSTAIGDNDFENRFFKGKNEDELLLLNAELAESVVDIKITTTEGVAINSMSYYPTINYVYWALNYYGLTIELIN